MQRPLWARIRDKSQRFYRERVPPTLGRSEIRARLVDSAGADLESADGFARAWSAHLQTTPTSLWKNAPPLDAAELERVRNGEVEVLERRFRVTPDVDWHRDPFSGVQWPRRHVESVSYRRDGSDIDLLWRLNQTKFLLRYAAAWRTTGDAALARDAYRFMDSWSVANPYLVGANWHSPLEAGTRLVVWSMVLAAVTDVPPPENEVCERIMQSILRQADHLAGHFSHRDVPNNHLIGEAAMLFMFAAYWPILRAAPEWMRLAEAVLAREAERQILKDGFTYEGAFNYQCYILDFFLLYLHACALREMAPDPSVLRAVRAMIDVMVSAVSPSGRLPMIGDDSTTEFLVVRGWTSIPRPSPLGVAFEDLVRPAHARVLAGAAWGRELLAVRAPLEYSRSCFEAGIDVARGHDYHLVFTHGPQHRRLFPHGHLHADAGSFELEMDGVPLLIDSGTYLYYRDPAARDHFRSARAHNTLLVDGVEPMKPLDTFTWETVAAGEALGFGVDEDVASVASRRALLAAGGDSFLHDRAVVRVGATVLVADALRARVSTGSHWASALFHTPLTPDAVTAPGERVALTDAARFLRVFEAFSPRKPLVEIVDPGDPSSQYSRWYGDIRRGSTVRVSAEFERDLAMVTALRTPEATVEPLRISTAEITCAVEGPARRRVVAIRFEPLSIVVSGRLIAGAGKRFPSHDPASSSMDWLEELWRGRS